MSMRFRSSGKSSAVLCGALRGSQWPISYICVTALATALQGKGTFCAVGAWPLVQSTDMDILNMSLYSPSYSLTKKGEKKN